MLARVTPRALSALPGVFIIIPTKKSGGGKGGGGGGGKAETDPELAGSNVLSVGEGVLLKWLSYHLEQANRVSEQAKSVPLRPAAHVPNCFLRYPQAGTGGEGLSQPFDHPATKYCMTGCVKEGHSARHFQEALLALNVRHS